MDRGAYLVEGAEHCGLCHTPKNVMGGDQNGQANQGSVLQSWYAPNLTGSSHVGLGDWSADDIMLYLKTGRNRFVMASGPMADAVTHSTSHLTDVDLQAIATYLKSLPPGGGTLPQPISAEEPKMQRGGVIYYNQCAACHGAEGQGIVGLFPRLAGVPVVQQQQATSLIRVVLEGSRAVATAGAPTGPAMPSFDWTLSDDDVAALLTYIRTPGAMPRPAFSRAMSLACGPRCIEKRKISVTLRNARSRSALHDQSDVGCAGDAVGINHLCPCASRQDAVCAARHASAEGAQPDWHNV